MIRIETARRHDLESIERLLVECDLPLAGVKDHLERFVVAVEGGSGARDLRGCAGIEMHGSACVLRSLAVHPKARGRGVARALVEEILTRARTAGCGEAYLLTRTIVPMAVRHGFTRVERSEVPASLLTTTEFALDACALATVMRKRL